MHVVLDTEKGLNFAHSEDTIENQLPGDMSQVTTQAPAPEMRFPMASGCSG